jgi:hypothetical protein
MTKREDIIVGLGGDSKALLKELNMTRQKANQWGRDIAKEITTGRIPEAWKGYTANVKDALKKVDEDGKKTSSSLEQSLTGAATKAIAAFVGFKTVKKVFTEIRDAMKEVSQGIDEFNTKIDAAGYAKQKKKELYSQLSDSEQRDIVTAQFQTTGFFDKIKIQAAKFGALAVTSAQTYAGVAGGKGFEESFQGVRGDQKKIWAGMQIAASEEKLKKLAEEKAKAEKEQTAARAQRIKLIDAEMKAWREQNAIARGIMQARQDRVNAWRANASERIAIAGEYNAQAMLTNLPGNPEAGEKRNADQAALVDRIRAYGAQRPKTIREKMQDALAARNQPRITAQEAMNKLASIIKEDAMLVRVKLAK